MKITPNKELVLVKVVENEDFYSEKTPAGLVLPYKHNMNMLVGEVLENGFLVFESPPGKDTRVVFPKHAGNQIVLDDGHYILLRPSDILCLID